MEHGIKLACQFQSHINSPNNISLSLKRKKYILYLMDCAENDLQLHWRKRDVPNKADMFRLHTMPRLIEKTFGGTPKEKPAAHGLNGIFQDLCTELIHNRNDEDINIRIYNLETEFWNEFTCVRMEVSLIKPGGKDFIHLPGIQAKSPCGIVHCPCRQGSFCAFTRLCSYSELKPAFEFKEYFGRQYCCLRIMVSVTFFKNEEPPTDTKLNRICSASRERLGRKILTEKLYSDFALKVGTKIFPCHRSVLAGHSEVFAAMFDSDMTEAKSQELVVEDMSTDGVQAFLKYLYHGDIQDAILDPEIALELLRAGNKYGIEYLEALSKEVLMSLGGDKFNASSALHMFAFCGKVDGFFSLEEKAVKIIKQNADQFTSSKEFAHLLEADLEVALHLMRRLAG